MRPQFVGRTVTAGVRVAIACATARSPKLSTDSASTAASGRLDVLNEGLLEPITGFLVLDAALRGEWDVFRDALQHIVLPGAVHKIQEFMPSGPSMTARRS